MAWVSPTGHNDPSEKWLNETRAYDENEGNWASADDAHIGWLELTLTAPISCDKIRIMAASLDIPDIRKDPDLKIEVYYGDAWHEIFVGTITKDIWVEKAIGSTQTVSKAQIKWTGAFQDYGLVCEFDFNEVVGGEEKLLTATCSASSSTSGSLMLGKIEAMTAIAAAAINLPSTTLQLLYSITAHAPPATSAAGSLSVVKSLSGTSSAASATSGSLTLGKVESLSGTSSTTSSVSGSIILTWSLSGTSQAASSTQGTLTLGVIEALTGTASVGTSTQATLFVFKVLTATSSAASSATGSLTLGRIEALTATVSAQSSTSGQLGLVRPLAGTSSAVCALTGSLTLGKIEDLTATADIASAIQGSLTLGRIESLSGTGSVTSTVEGTLTVVGEVLLSSTCQSISSASGSLTVINLVKLMKKLIQLEEIEA